MADQKCRKCGHLFVDGDEVEAHILTKYRALKSKIAYALDKPTECTYVAHIECTKLNTGD